MVLLLSAVAESPTEKMPRIVCMLAVLAAGLSAAHTKGTVGEGQPAPGSAAVGMDVCRKKKKEMSL